MCPVIGMVALSIFGSVSMQLLEACAQDHVPDCALPTSMPLPVMELPSNVHFHKGWKKWVVKSGDAQVRYQCRDDAISMSKLWETIDNRCASLTRAKLLELHSTWGCPKSNPNTSSQKSFTCSRSMSLSHRLGRASLRI